VKTVAPAKSKAADAIVWAHDFLGFTWEQVGHMLGASDRTVQRWRDYEVAPSREHEERIDALDELRFWVDTVFERDSEAAHDWLNTRLLDLKGKTPLHEIKAGRIERISEILATFHTGAFI
jgi:hypothetical protein